MKRKETPRSLRKLHKMREVVCICNGLTQEHDFEILSEADSVDKELVYNDIVHVWKMGKEVFLLVTMRNA